MNTFFSKLILCLLPLLLTPIWGYFIAEGYLNFGGGEKDLFLLLPWLVWSVIYLIFFIILWIKRKHIKFIALFSLTGATGVLAFVWFILFIWFNNIIGVYKG